MDPFVPQSYFQSRVQAVLGYHPHDHLVGLLLQLEGLCYLVLA